MIRVVGKRVIIKRDEKETVTQNGLYLPEAAVENTQSGTVVGVGTTTIVGVGDSVVFKRHAGTLYKQDDVKYIVLHERDLLGKFDGNEFRLLCPAYLVKIQEPETTIKHGSLELILPEDEVYHRIEGIYGKIVQVGLLGADDIKINPNETVCVKAHLGADITIDGQEYKIIKPIDIDGVAYDNNEE